MNKDGYKIINIGNGTENNYQPIVIVKANPIINNSSYSSFVPFEYNRTELFLFPDKDKIVNKIINLSFASEY